MNANLVTAIWPQAQERILSRAFLVLLAVVALTVSAKVQFPFWPVPMTLQTLAVLLIGASYGATLAASSVAAYLALGAIGLPVFASGAGLAYMAGPTGGYLAGFLLAATLVGWLSDRGMGRTIVSALLACLLGEVAIFVLGAGWLAVLIGPAKALAAGVAPFVPAEFLKAGLAASITALAWKRAMPRQS